MQIILYLSLTFVLLLSSLTTHQPSLEPALITKGRLLNVSACPIFDGCESLSTPYLIVEFCNSTPQSHNSLAASLDPALITTHGRLVKVSFFSVCEGYRLRSTLLTFLFPSHDPSALSMLSLTIRGAHLITSIKIRRSPRNLRPRTPLRRRLPSRHADPEFWAKVHNLPESLRRYLSPEWNITLTSCDDLKRLIWHFKPSQRILTNTRKAQLIRLFEVHVAHMYGAYYGI